jgi:hypothetical protein
MRHLDLSVWTGLRKTVVAGHHRCMDMPWDVCPLTSPSHQEVTLRIQMGSHQKGAEPAYMGNDHKGLLYISQR